MTQIKKPATLHDVAKHAGVGLMTVSRVINGGPHVSAEMRERVMDSVRALNYSPNLAARAARSGVLRFGLLYSNPSSAYLNEFLVGALDESGRSGGQLVLERCRGLQSQQTAMKKLLGAGVDGIMIPPPLCDSPAALKMLEEAGIPVVAVATARPQPGVAAVRIDDYEGARAMTRRLLELGHRDIGFIMGDMKHTPAILRLQAFTDTMHEAGLKVPPHRIAAGLFTYRSGLEATRLLLARADDRPTAIFASNDDMAAAVVALAHGADLKVPADLTVCGFDDTPVATTVWPELTTIHQPIGAMARAAVQLLRKEILLRRAGKPQSGAHHTLKFTLIERESSAPPRAALESSGPGGRSVRVPA